MSVVIEMMHSKALTNFPSVTGPGLKSFLNKNLAVIGMMKARYCAPCPRENNALVATGPAKASRAIMNPMNVLNQTALTGVCVYGFILEIQRDPGRAPSRANANVCREEAINCPQNVSDVEWKWYYVTYGTRPHHESRLSHQSPETLE